MKGTVVEHLLPRIPLPSILPQRSNPRLARLRIKPTLVQEHTGRVDPVINLVIHANVSQDSQLPQDLQTGFPSPQLPRLRIVLGSFDADSVRAHIGRQNDALLRDIARSLAGADAILFNGKAGETLVKEIVLNALAKGLGVQASDSYPSTYFESPGRYGVIDVLLPEGISVRPG